MIHPFAKGLAIRYACSNVRSGIVIVATLARQVTQLPQQRFWYAKKRTALSGSLCEDLGGLTCSDCMCVSAGKLPPLDMGLLMYVILGAATAIKIALFIYCFALKNQSDSMLALAEDHSNDIVSNLGAIAFGAIASISADVWWVDSLGAILISLYIIWSWARILQGQVRLPCTCSIVLQMSNWLEVFSVQDIYKARLMRSPLDD